MIIEDKSAWPVDVACDIADGRCFVRKNRSKSAFNSLWKATRSKPGAPVQYSGMAFIEGPHSRNEKCQASDTTQYHVDEHHFANTTTPCWVTLEGQFDAPPAEIRRATVGLMLLLSRNRFIGSYWFLIDTSRT